LKKDFSKPKSEPKKTKINPTEIPWTLIELLPSQLKLKAKTRRINPTAAIQLIYPAAKIESDYSERIMKQWKSRAVIILMAALAISVMASGARAQVSMPPINFQQKTLPNGMRVLSVVDHSSPTVAIQVWYHVGSKDDPNGRSGFAHLFEHIMFKATRNMKSEMMDRLTEDVGGFNNAFTNPDVTVYYEVVPSHYLETLLWAEADRLSGLTVDDPNFKSERSVVQEEYRQSYLAPPYGMLAYLIEQQSFVSHPYKRPTIGSIEDLDAASLENVRAFHQTFYRPDNATLVVVGDFEPRQLDAWVTKYFAPIPKPAGAVPRVTSVEPERKTERRIVHRRANVPLPAMALTYLVPSEKHPDAEALQVAATILSQGESSRLYRALVYDQQVAQSAEASTDLREDAGVFYFNIVLSSGKKPEDVERSLLSEITKMQTAPVSTLELNKAKNQLVTNEIQTRETSNGKALALGEAAVMLGDPNRVNTDLARLQAVSAADVQRVMKKYFTVNNRLVIYYLPEETTPPATGALPNGDTRKGGHGR
jgi:zinc protease